MVITLTLGWISWCTQQLADPLFVSVTGKLIEPANKQWKTKNEKTKNSISLFKCFSFGILFNFNIERRKKKTLVLNIEQWILNRVASSWWWQNIYVHDVRSSHVDWNLLNYWNDCSILISLNCGGGCFLMPVSILLFAVLCFRYWNLWAIFVWYVCHSCITL